MGNCLNVLTGALRDFCREHVLEEKVVLAPSRRVGFQWLDAVARSGQPVFNARSATLKGLALSLAAPGLDSAGLALASQMQLEVLADAIVFEILRGGGGGQTRAGYLTSLAPSAGLTRIVANAFRELRLAGVDSESLGHEAFEAAEKGLEVKAMLRAFEIGLRERHLTDYAGTLELAILRLRDDPDALAGTRVLIPDELYDGLVGLERALVDDAPEGTFVVVPTDHAGEAPDGVLEHDLTDAMLLRWTAAPSGAPPPRGDGSVTLLAAVGEVNEVREVFRRCVEKAIPLDEVEVVHTDADTYVPLFYELSVRMLPEDADDLPVTFAEGVPARYSRPGRALLAWLAWIGEGYPQQLAVRMIRDGLLEVPGMRESGLSFARLGAILRGVPIGAGLDRYTTELEKAASNLGSRLSLAARAADEDADDEHALSPSESKALSIRLDGLRALLSLISQIEAHVPETSADQRSWLAHARYFLEKTARSVSKIDNYSAEKLLEAIDELDSCLADGGPASFDVASWLAELPSAVRVAGQGPRPGCLHLSDLRGGGHSGRPHTFIVGMDDTRFPGAGLQDPLMLDNERAGVSADLTTAAKRVEAKVNGFATLAARLRGDIVASYCCRSLSDDREMFPSRVLTSAFRVLKGQPVNSIELASPPASFAPSSEPRCIDMTEWWMWRTCAAGPVIAPGEVLGQNFPNLARGSLAIAARASDLFTEYDGYVPAAGADNDCTAQDSPPVSPSRLETLAKCPLEYFFKYILKIEPPEEYEIDPARWLDPMEQGSLLHAVFCDFMRGLDSAGLMPPDFDRDREGLRMLVDQYIDEKRLEKPPPPDPGIFAVARDHIHRTAEVFLQMEEAYCRDHLPIACELAIGVKPEGGGTAYDIVEACTVTLPDGRKVRVRCKLDRIDKVLRPEGAGYVVCDYKTGASGRYHSNGPFHMGRFMQGALYPILGEVALRERHGGEARVVRFEYVFPSPAEARRVGWDTDELAEGLALVALLCEMISTGCFPMTDDAKDLAYSDYLQVYGDVNAAVAAIDRKMDNPANVVLEPYRRLRGAAADEEG